MDRLHYKFTKQEAKPVTSPLIEVRETYTGPYTTPEPIVKEVDIEHIEDSATEESEQQKGKIYKTKKEFIDEMTTAYTNELLHRGLDPMFAKYLVAQDGLESNWGKSSLGYHFNYGGIKEIRPGKGVAKPTNEFLNGKMEKVSDNFREFASLQEYVKYKVGLLNNNRYRAFSSHPGDFIFRVVSGGYATDPEYVNKFNRYLNSFQNGGVLQRRVITPAEVEAKKERTNDIIRDKNILANLVKEDSALLKLFPNRALANFIANRYIQRINDTAVKVGSKDTTGRSGFIEVHDLNDRSAIKKGTIKLTKDIVEAAVKRRSGDLNKVISELDTIRNKYPNGHEFTKEDLVNEKTQLNADSELTKLGMDLGFLLDHLAYNTAKKESDIVYAQDGRKMSGIPFANLENDYKERYDYSSDFAYDENTGHYGSRNRQTGKVLKGVGHPTRMLAFDADQEAGYNWYRGYDGNVYSKTIYEAAYDPMLKSQEPMKRYELGRPANVNNYKQVEPVYKHLLNLGATPEQAAGITGVFLQESELNHKSKSSAGATGIAQLLGDKRRQYKVWLRETKRPDTWQNQTEWVWNHVNSGKDSWQDYYDSLKNTVGKHTTYDKKMWESMSKSKYRNYSYESFRKQMGNLNAADLAELFTWTFERPGEKEAMIENRRDYATQIYNKFNESK